MTGVNGPLDITIVGTGVYVAGRGTDGFGTILPAISEWQRNGGLVRRVRVVGTNPENASALADRAAQLATATGVAPGKCGLSART